MWILEEKAMWPLLLAALLYVVFGIADHGSAFLLLATVQLIAGIGFGRLIYLTYLVVKPRR